MNRAIANHLKALIAARPYAGTVAGIVMPVTVKRGGKTIVYATDNDVLGTSCEPGDLTVMAPDASKNSIFYFEDRSGVIVDKVENGIQFNRCTLTLVGWLNLARLGYDSSACAWGYRIYRDILKLLPPPNQTLTVGDCTFLGLTISFEKQHQRGAEVFGRYTFAQAFREFSLPPTYDYFAIDLECKWKTSIKCAAEIPEPNPGTCPPPRRGSVTVNGEESKTNTIKVEQDGVAVGDFDPVSGIVEIEPCGSGGECPAITVNGIESDTHIITVTRAGDPVGTFNPASGNVDIPACPAPLIDIVVYSQGIEVGHYDDFDPNSSDQLNINIAQG